MPKSYQLTKRQSALIRGLLHDFIGMCNDTYADADDFGPDADQVRKDILKDREEAEALRQILKN